MKCIKLATRTDGFQFPCGQCKNCRINHRRDWQSRLLLEASSHAHSCFVTLTFADTGIPPILRRSDLKRFFRALRVYIPDARHFSVGEYGKRFGRAHYHTHIFSNVPVLATHLAACWPFGHVDIGDTEPASLDYTLGYLLKDKRSNVWPIESRFPEFRAFSPGIGKMALPHLLIDGNLLPREYKVFGNLWPVSRYLRQRAKKMGFDVSQTEEKRLEEFEAQQMRAVLRNPSLTQAEVSTLYDGFVKKRQEKLEVLKKKAIRDAYRQIHGHVKTRSKNETF
ncbi:replication initiator protein [Apis mellifera associated microvirus 48]|nr:replication initiator protein [Apis mellifera associated microvirus 48]